MAHYFVSFVNWYKRNFEHGRGYADSSLEALHFLYLLLLLVTSAFLCITFDWYYLNQSFEDIDTSSAALFFIVNFVIVTVSLYSVCALKFIFSNRRRPRTDRKTLYTVTISIAVGSNFVIMYAYKATVMFLVAHVSIGCSLGLRKHLTLPICVLAGLFCVLRSADMQLVTPGTFFVFETKRSTTNVGSFISSIAYTGFGFVLLECFLIQSAVLLKVSRRDLVLTVAHLFKLLQASKNGKREELVAALKAADVAFANSMFLRHRDIAHSVQRICYNLTNVGNNLHDMREVIPLVDGWRGDSSPGQPPEPTAFESPRARIQDWRIAVLSAERAPSPQDLSGVGLGIPTEPMPYMVASLYPVELTVMTVLFSPPDDNDAALGSYLHSIISLVKVHGGQMSSYSNGRAVLTWSLGNRDSNCRNAILGGFAMQAAAFPNHGVMHSANSNSSFCSSLNNSASVPMITPGLTPLQPFNIGIHTSECWVGPLGSPVLMLSQELDGDAVTVSNTLAVFAQHVNGQFLISKEVHEAALQHHDPFYEFRNFWFSSKSELTDPALSMPSLMSTRVPRQTSYPIIQIRPQNFALPPELRLEIRRLFESALMCWCTKQQDEEFRTLLAQYQTALQSYFGIEDPVAKALFSIRM